MRRYNDPSRGAVRRSILKWGFPSIVDLLSTYGGRARELQPWMAGAQISRDRNLRLQYLAGMDLNSYNEVPIYNAIASYRTYPEDLFIAVGSTHFVAGCGGERPGAGVGSTLIRKISFHGADHNPRIQRSAMKAAVRTWTTGSPTARSSALTADIASRPSLDRASAAHIRTSQSSSLNAVLSS